MRIIDFTDIDMYPKKYWYTKGMLTIKTLVLDNVERQEQALTAKNDQLLLGDAMKVSFTFGHNTEPDGLPEKWIDLPVEGVYRVTKIIPRPDTKEIELVVRRQHGGGLP